MLRTRDEVRSFVRAKLAQEMPPERFLQLTRAYTLLGLLPDSLDLRAVMEDMLSQQIAGYYDPDSATLYGVEGAEGPVLRLTVAHELVHALQDQYMPLDSILKDKSSNDRSAPRPRPSSRDRPTTPPSSCSRAPRSRRARSSGTSSGRRETRCSPAAAWTRRPPCCARDCSSPISPAPSSCSGGDESPFRDTLPYGPRMPRSTEQIMHPERYERGDNPINVRFTDTVPGSYEDVLGEFDIRLLMQELTGRKASDAALPLGWGGDRFRLDEGNGGPALVWISVWDEPRHRDWFLSATGNEVQGPREARLQGAGRHPDGGRSRRPCATSSAGRMDRMAGAPGAIVPATAS